MALTFRLAREQDADVVRALVREAYALYVERMDREPAPMTADYAGLAREGKITIAEEDGQCLGIMVSYPRADHLHVENVAVPPSGQGRGVGRALMEQAEAQASTHDLETIELYTNEVMRENVPFYEALGYRIVGEGVEDGYNRIFFRKDVSPDR